MILLLKRLYWLWQLAEARAFAASLEQTIANERRRSKDWLEMAETMSARAEIEIVKARADRKIRERAEA